MAAAPLIPQPFWVRPAFLARRREGMPRTSGTGRLLDLPGSCALPALESLLGREPWATFRVAWNARGLGLSVAVGGAAGLGGRRPDALDRDPTVQVWVDTRDTRDIHRASRFCHRFSASLSAGPGALTATIAPKPIPQALAEAPRAKPDTILARAEPLPAGWLLEVFLSAEALHGFDPETNRRLGLLIMASDPERGDATLNGLGREFPLESDPSLWPTLELRDEPGESS